MPTIHQKYILSGEACIMTMDLEIPQCLCNISVCSDYKLLDEVKEHVHVGQVGCILLSR